MSTSNGVTRIIERGPPGFGVENGVKKEIEVRDGEWSIVPAVKADLTARMNHTGSQDMSTVAGLTAALAVKAASASPQLTGVPTAPNAPASTNSQQIATTAFVQEVIALLQTNSPATLATLNLIKAALDADPDVVLALTNGLAVKADKATALAGSGLAVASGTLGAGPAIAVAKASAAEVAAGARDDAAMTPAAAAGQAMLSAEFRWARTDAQGYVIEAQRHDGAMVTGLYTHAQGLWRARAGLYDEQGGAIFEKDRFGVDLEASLYDAWIANGQIYALVNGDVIQLTSGATVYAKAEIRAGQMVIVRSDGRRFASALAGSFPPLDPFTDTIEYSDLYGQSNAASSGSGAVINGTAFDSRFLMFTGGQHAFADALGQNRGRYALLQPIPDAIHDFVQGREQVSANSGETANSGFAHGVLSAPWIGGNVSLITTCSAVGSANMEMLWRAATENTDANRNAIGDPWRNLEAKFVRAALFWRLNGFKFQAGPLRWNQGEGNFARTKANHLAALQTVRDDWQALAAAWNALRTSGGQAGKAPLIAAQMSNGNFYGAPASEVPWAQLQINLDDAATALCCGPMYDQAHLGDGVHLTALGQEMQGARQAVAYNEWLKGNLFYPLHVRKDAGFQPVRTGANVRLRIRNHFNLALTFDTVTIQGLGADQGFRWRDDGNGNAVTVTSAAIVDNTTIDLTLSEIPTGSGGAIDIAMTGTPGASAGPVTGNRATLRTSGSGITTRTGGRAVEHFICIDRVPVI